MARKYNFKLNNKTCRSCQTTFQGHSNRHYCSEKCRNKKYDAKRYAAKVRLSTLENFLKEKVWGATKRGKHEVTITYEDVVALWNKQNGLCALSKVPMTHLKGHGFVDTNVSLDRIDSSKPYELKNVQLVCLQVNYMKNVNTEERLHFWCERILNGN